VVRETWEEVGLDLNAEDFIPVGRLDDREITSAQDGKLIMMLSPFGKDNGNGKSHRI
jgi:8-oxo-dGTP pyrophosphatase MutT (NUDIX family)